MSIRESAGGEGGALGQRLTEAKMKSCRWLNPVLVGQFEFVVDADQPLRHWRFRIKEGHGTPVVWVRAPTRPEIS